MLARLRLALLVLALLDLLLRLMVRRQVAVLRKFRGVLVQQGLCLVLVPKRFLQARREVLCDSFASALSRLPCRRDSRWK